MNKSTKGALAAGAAAVLLMGGAGTLAFWTSSQNVDGGAIASGHLRLTADATNVGCGAWQLDSAEQVPVTYNPGDPLVPGDVLTKACAYTLEATGNHMRGALSLSAPTLTPGAGAGTFGTDLQAAISAVTVGGATLPGNEFTEANNNQAVAATITVTFLGTSGNASQDAQATLEALTLTATQVHN